MGACPAPKSNLFGEIGVGRRPFHSIALAQPLQQVAILAALAAKGLMFGDFGLATERAFGGFSFG
jgi:hypothetical protein